MSFFVTKAVQERREGKEARLVAIEGRIEKLEAQTLNGRKNSFENEYAGSKEAIEKRMTDLSGVIHEQESQIKEFSRIMSQGRVEALEKKVEELLCVIQGLERRIGDSRRSSTAPVTPIAFTFGGTARSVSCRSSKEIEPLKLYE